MVPTWRLKHTLFPCLCHTKKEKNFIKNKIKVPKDRTVYEKADIAATFRDNFQKMYSSSELDAEVIEKCLETINKRVSAEMTSKLEAPISAFEVSEALKQMEPFKSPGPDGFGAGFYQE